MQETEIPEQHPATPRYKEAEYFLSQFIKNCGPPIDSYFLMVCYFDAFLFALVSIEEMLSKDTRTVLQEKDETQSHSSTVWFLRAVRDDTSPELYERTHS